MKNKVVDNPLKNHDFNYLVIITAIMVTCYLTSNIMAVKLVNIMGYSWFDAGTISFPLAYMLGDVLTEIWGYKTAKKIIYLTFVCNLIMTLFTYIGVLLPSGNELGNAYNTVFTFTPRILIASLIGFLIGELSNAKTMEIIKHITKGKYLFIRTILSSVIGYVFDTGLFVIIAFLGLISIKEIIMMIIMQYFIKLIIESIFATPLAYLVINYLKGKIYG
jgi:uncharacterized integral membrane protein (TIGR00697 family)